MRLTFYCNIYIVTTQSQSQSLLNNSIRRKIPQVISVSFLWNTLFMHANLNSYYTALLLEADFFMANEIV